MYLNHLSPKAEARDAGAKGWGIYAVAPIPAGETVCGFGGWVVDGATLRSLPDDRRAHSIQVDDDLWMVGPEVAEPGDLVNHSCEPNLGILGNVVLKALRDIAPGEELTFDYAMSDSDPYDEFTCACGAPSCRGRVTGQDWRRSDLQQRYAGWFSAYLARRIAGPGAGNPRP